MTFHKDLLNRVLDTDVFKKKGFFKDGGKQIPRHTCAVNLLLYLMLKPCLKMSVTMSHCTIISLLKDNVKACFHLARSLSNLAIIALFVL